MMICLEYESKNHLRLPDTAKCDWCTCALARAEANAKHGRGLIQDRRLCTDAIFIRAQSAICADGPPSAQAP